NAIDTAQTNIFSVGTNWHSPWRSYLQDAPDSGTSAGGYAQYFRFLGDGSGNGYLLGTWDTETGIYFADEGTNHVFTYNSGERHIYGADVTIGGTHLWFLSRIEDPEGNPTSFKYIVTNNVVLLNKVIDVDGRETTFEYTNTAYYPYQLSKVISPFGQTAVLGYSSSGQLTSITDALNLQSTMSYDTSNRVSKLITPYGTNTFD